MLGKFLKQWYCAKDATTAIEFSLLAMPYLLLTLCIIEVSFMLTSASLLESAVSQSTRLIRTGQLQQQFADPTEQEEAFRQALCNYAVVLVNCNDVTIEARNIENFSSYSDYGPSFDDNGDLESSGFDAGGVSDVILIRAGYRYRIMTPFMGSLIGQNGDNSRYFMSTIVLQTEPYEFEGS